MAKTGHEGWTDRLSDYLDGSLPLVERVQMRRHLAECTSCTAVLAELRAVVARANDLRGESEPEVDLWSGVLAGIEGRSTPAPWLGGSGGARRMRFPFRWPQLAAASVALTTVGAGVWLALSRGSEALVEVQPPAQVEQPQGVVSDETDAVVAELERALAENRAMLDPSTVGVIDANLAILDTALDEARRALADDPGSTYLSHHLADTMRRKLQLLRDANALAQQ
jgi:anti-sigma factor RsiW